MNNDTLSISYSSISARKTPRVISSNKNAFCPRKARGSFRAVEHYCLIWPDLRPQNDNRPASGERVGRAPMLTGREQYTCSLDYSYEIIIGARMLLCAARTLLLLLLFYCTVIMLFLLLSFRRSVKLILNGWAQGIHDNRKSVLPLSIAPERLHTSRTGYLKKKKKNVV